MDRSLQAVYVQPVKSILCRHIGDYMKVKGLLTDCLKGVADRKSLLLRTNSSHHVVTMLEKHVDNMPGDEASSTYTGTR